MTATLAALSRLRCINFFSVYVPHDIIALRFLSEYPRDAKLMCLRLTGNERQERGTWPFIFPYQFLG